MKNRVGITQEKMLMWHDQLMAEGYIEMIHQKSKDWNSKNIYQFSSKAREVNKGDSITSEDSSFRETNSSSKKDKSNESQINSNESSILEDQALYQYFENFIIKGYSHNFHDFYWQAKFFKEIDDNKVKKFKAEEIYLTFLKPKKPRSIRIPDFCRLYVREKYKLPNDKRKKKKKKNFHSITRNLSFIHKNSFQILHQRNRKIVEIESFGEIYRNKTFLEIAR